MAQHFTDATEPQTLESVCLPASDSPTAPPPSSGAQPQRQRQQQQIPAVKSIHICSICERIFSSRATLTVHERHQHNSDDAMAFACATCDKRFVHKSQLRSHERRHTGETPFECEVRSSIIAGSVDIPKISNFHRHCRCARRASATARVSSPIAPCTRASGPLRAPAAPGRSRAPAIWPSIDVRMRPPAVSQSTRCSVAGWRHGQVASVEGQLGVVTR